MKERPILFSEPMVRAILAGNKTMTRRVVKPQQSAEKINADPELLQALASEQIESLELQGFDVRLDANGDARAFPPCPYGQPGDRLWVRETWRTDSSLDSKPPRSFCRWPVQYIADGAARSCGAVYGNTHGKTRVSIHMPRWASRITLEITDVRVERLLDISEEGAIAEGCMAVEGMKWHTFKEAAAGVPMHDHTAKDAFEALWDSINGEGSSDANPWVWVVEFKRVETSRD